MTNVIANSLKSKDIAKYANRKLKTNYSSKFRALEALVVKYEKKANAEKNIKPIVKYLASTYSSLNTRASYLTDLKKHYQKLIPDSDKLDLLKLDVDESKERKAKQTSARNNSRNNPVKISTGQVIEIYGKLKSLDSIAAKILLLIGCTGRRVIEILKETPIPEQDKETGEIIITKVAKNKDNYKQITPFNEPLIFLKYDRMKEIWTEVRDHLEEKGDNTKTNAGLSNKYVPLCKKQLYKVLPDEFRNRKFGGQKVATHILRKFYGVMAYRMSDQNEIQSVFLTRVLGHKKGSSSYQNYHNVLVRDDFEGKQGETKQQQQQIPKVDDEVQREYKNLVEIAANVEELTERFDNMSFQPVDEQIQAVVDELKSAGKPASYKNLRQAGFGNTRISKYKKAKMHGEKPARTDEQKQLDSIPNKFVALEQFANSQPAEHVFSVNKLMKELKVGRKKAMEFRDWRVSTNRPLLMR